MNPDIKKALMTADEDNDPIAKSTIAYAEKFADKLFRSGVTKPIISTGNNGCIYFQWSAPGSCALVAVKDGGKAVFAYSTKERGGQSKDWMLGEKIPSEFFKAMKEMDKENGL